MTVHVICQICLTLTGPENISPLHTAVQITGNWPITLSPYLPQYSLSAPDKEPLEGSVSPCLSGSGMSPPEGPQSTHFKGLPCRERAVHYQTSR